MESQKSFGDADRREQPDIREAVAAHDRQAAEVLEAVQARNAIVSEVCAIADVEGRQPCEELQTIEAGVREVVAEGEVQGCQGGDRRELCKTKICDTNAAPER